jgi:hypothetical protein
VALAALAVAAWWWRSRDASPARLPFEGLAALTTGLILLPVAWDHYVLLLAPLLIFAAGALVARKESGLVTGLMAAYFLMAARTPTAIVGRASTTGVLDAAVVSHYFAGAVLAIVVGVLAARKA